MPATRAAIFAADVAGYSRLMGADEGTHNALKELRRELVDPGIREHHGRIVKTTGDGLLVEFASVVDAVRGAIAIQRGMAARNTSVPAEHRIAFRIGINLGDIIAEEDDIYGDGVNVAARLEALAEPGGICLSEDAFRQVHGKIDAEFADIGQQSLKNIAKPIRVYRVVPERPTEAQPPALPLPDKPSIAVLPFANMSGDPEQEYFADGMVEEIITALSRIRWLFVIARNSSFTYKGQAIDVKRVGQELGVRYVLEGSVRKAGNRVRITAQLIDALSGSHLWADRFDGSLEDIFELQERVAVVIEPTLEMAEMRRSAERPTTDLGAYDLYLRAVAIRASMTKDRNIDALALLEQAIAIDQHYGPALAVAAGCHLQLVINGWAEEPEISRSRASEFARRALEVGETDPRILAQAAFVLAYFGKDTGAMIALVDRALVLNPSYALGWFFSGFLRIFCRSARSRDRACRDLAAAEPARAHGYALVGDRHGLFPQTSV
jgi:TolB-like protein